MFESSPSQTFVEFKRWDQALKQFLVEMGLIQTLRGFENDMLVLNPDWEKEGIPVAMAKFVRNLVVCSDHIQAYCFIFDCGFRR